MFRNSKSNLLVLLLVFYSFQGLCEHWRGEVKHNGMIRSVVVQNNFLTVVFKGDDFYEESETVYKAFEHVAKKYHNNPYRYMRQIHKLIEHEDDFVHVDHAHTAFMADISPNMLDRILFELGVGSTERSNLLEEFNVYITRHERGVSTSICDGSLSDATRSAACLRWLFASVKRRLASQY